MHPSFKLVVLFLLLPVLGIGMQSDDFVPYRSKSGTYNYVEKGSATPAFEGEWERAYLFQDGMARVFKDEKYGFINNNGELVVPLIYEYAEDFEQGTAIVGYSKDDGMPLRGMIDIHGTVLTPLIYEQFGAFSEGYRSVLLDEHVGFVNREGALTIPVIYRASIEALPYFHEGLCSVENPWEEYASTFGFIDTIGEFVLLPHFELWGGAAMHNMPIFSEGLSVVKKGDKFGYMNKEGAMVLPAIYDAADAFSEGLAPVRMKDKIIFIAKDGKQAFDLVLGGMDEDIMGFSYPGFENGRAHVNLNRKGESSEWGSYYFAWESGVIDRNGEIISTTFPIPGFENQYFLHTEKSGEAVAQIQCKINSKTITIDTAMKVSESNCDNFIIINRDWSEGQYYYIDENGFEYRE